MTATFITLIAFFVLGGCVGSLITTSYIESEWKKQQINQ